MAEETRKFKYGDSEFDSEKLARYLHENASGYALSLGWNEKDTKGFMDSVNNLIGRVQSGDADSLNYQGQVHTNSSGFENMPTDRKKILGMKIGLRNKDYNGFAVGYLDKAIQALNNTIPAKSKEDTTLKWSNEGLSKAWKNKYFGGLDPDENGLNSIWLDLDKANESGTRLRTNRLLNYAQLLDEYANSEDLDKYDYTGSAHKDASDYRTKLQNAANAARSGKYEDFIKAYGAAGGNLAEANMMFTEGTVKPVEKSEFDTAWEEQLKNIPSGTSPEEIALMKLRFQLKWNQEKYGDFYDWQYRNLYNDWANQHYTGSGSDLLASLGTTAWNDDDKLFWLGSGLDTDEGQKRYGYFNDKNHKAYALKLFDDLISGKSVNLEASAPSSGRKNKDILRAFMYQGKQGSNNDITEIDKDSYFINSTFDINTGTGIKYNSKKRTFERVHVDPTKTPKLAKALKEKWLKANPYKGSGNLLTWAKKGAKLRALKFGDNIQQTSKDRVDKLYEDAILKEMKETGKTRRLVELGHGYGLQGSNLRKGVDEVKMTTADWMRLGSALNDVASIGVSYTGAGMPVAAAMLLGGLGVDTAADIIDPSKSWGEVGTNLLTNVGLGAATAIGGGALAKAGKIGKTLKTLLPVAMTYMGASSLMQDPNFKKTVDKITSGNWKSFTSNDMKNINMLTKLVAGGHLATKSAAGAIGTQYGNLNSVTGRIARGAGKWGNNAWNSKRFSSLRANYNLMNAFNLQGGMKQGVITTTSDGMVEIGGLKVKPETAKLMLTEGNKARRSGKNATDILNAMLNAFRNSAEGKSKITSGQTIPEVKANLLNVAEGTDAAASRAAMENAIGLQAEGTGFKLNGNFMEGNGKFNLNGKTNVASGDVPAELMAIYDQAIANGKSHTEAQGLINNTLGSLFNKPALTVGEQGMPGFNFDNIVGDKGWWNPSRYFGNVAEITDNNPGWFARHNTKYSSPLDADTPEGRANLAIFKDNPMNRGNWNSDVAFNLGLGFKNTGINAGLQSMKEYGLQQRQLRTNVANLRRQQSLTNALNALRLRKLLNKPSQDIILQKQFEKELSKTPELKNHPDIATTQIEKYKQATNANNLYEALKNAKLLAISEGRSLRSVLRNPLNNPATTSHSPLYTNSNPYVLQLDTSNPGIKHPSNRMTTYTTAKGKIALTNEAVLELKNLGVNINKRAASVYGKYNSDWWKAFLGIKDPSIKINHIYKKNGLYYWWKQGGKLKALREGGLILKYQDGKPIEFSNDELKKRLSFTLTPQILPIEIPKLEVTKINDITGKEIDLSKKGSYTNGEDGGKTPLKFSKTFNLFIGIGLKLAPEILKSIDSSNTNLKIRDLNNQKDVALVSHTLKHLNTTGDYNQLSQAELEAGRANELGANLAATSTDGRIGMLAQLEANRQASEARNKGILLYNTSLKESADKATQQEFANIDLADADQAENLNRLVQLRNAKLDGEMAYQNQEHANRTQLIDAVTGIANDYANKYQLFKESMLTHLYNTSFKDDVELLKLYKKAIATNSTDADILAYKDYRAKKEAELNPVYYESLAANRGIDYDYSDNPFANLRKKLYGFNTLPYIKSGGKVSEDGPKRAKHKELERLRKQRKDEMDNNDKKLERLSRSTLLHLKRSMGK